MYKLYVEAGPGHEGTGVGDHRKNPTDALQDVAVGSVVTNEMTEYRQGGLGLLPQIEAPIRAYVTEFNPFNGAPQVELVFRSRNDARAWFDLFCEGQADEDAFLWASGVHRSRSTAV